MNTTYRDYELQDLQLPHIDRFTDILIHEICDKELKLIKNKKLADRIQRDYLGISPYNVVKDEQNNDILHLFENSAGGTVLELSDGYLNFATAQKTNERLNGPTYEQQFGFVHFVIQALKVRFGNRVIPFKEALFPADTRYTTLMADSIIGTSCPPGWPDGSIVASVAIELFCKGGDITVDEINSIVIERKNEGLYGHHNPRKITEIHRHTMRLSRK